MRSMRWKASWTMALVVLMSTGTAAALDCARVRSLHAEKKRAADIARELGITTPEVQACLADADEGTTPPREQSGGIGLAPALPGNDAPVPRPPNQ